MKKTKSIKFICAIVIATLAIMLLVINSISSVSAYYNAPNKLIVKGSSEINFKPDSASVCLGVETVNSNLTVAQKENAETMEKVIETLTNNGIDKNEIKTTSYNIFKQHNYNNGSEFLNTQVSNRICFKTSNIDGLSDLITKLTESGANVFGGITFELSNSSVAYNQALEKAIENAKSKAEILAPNANPQIEEIMEEYSYCSPCYYDNYARAELTSNNIMQGDVKVCAFVKVIFSCDGVSETNTQNSVQSNTELKNKTEINSSSENKTETVVTNQNKTTETTSNENKINSTSVNESKPLNTNLTNKNTNSTNINTNNLNKTATTKTDVNNNKTTNNVAA